MKNLIFALAFLLLTIPCSAEIIIVDDDWPYDFNNIQAAIDYSSDGDFIFVFPGRYTGSGNRDIDFLGKAVTVQSVVPTDPYIVAQTIIDCNGGRGFYFGSGENADSVLAGFAITHGSNAIYCTNSSPTIACCIISGNTVSKGSGIYCNYSSPIITNCTITENSAGLYGGGIYCYNNSSPTITNCIITGNSSGHDSGGIYCYWSNPKIINCTITGNSAVRDGGGFYCYNSSSPVITNCTITGNSAVRDGGGICCYFTSSPKVTNCTITGNSAKRNGGGIFLASSSLSIFVTSSIVWGNADSSGQGQSAQIYGTPTLNVWFSCIQDENPDDVNVPFGEEQYNIDDDPCFVGIGYWVDANDPNIIVEPNDSNAIWLDGDYHLLPASPCIETGDPSFTYHPGDVDMDGQPRLMGRRVDMGADEFELVIIVVTEPQGGDAWIAGSTREIEWESYGITGTVDISYSDNNGADWVIIENDVADTGSFTWHLPDTVDSNRCLVSVEPNTTFPTLICIKSGIFTIRPDSKWKSLGGNFDRSGLSQNYGPEVGCVKWQFQTSGPVSASPTVGAAGRVHLACEDGNLYTLDANGVLLWSYDTNSPLLSSPSIGPDGTVFVGAENGKLYAIDIDGNLRWTHATGGPIYSSPAVSTDGYVFACSLYGTLYALAQDGSELWNFETGGVGIATGAIFASPAIGPDGTVYIAGLYDPNLYALDPNNGSVKWTCTFLDPCEPNGLKLRPFASPVVAPDGTIYLALLCNHKRLIMTYGGGYWYDSKLYAIDSNNGNVIWATNMTETATHEEELYGPPEPNYLFRKYYDYVPEGAPLYPYTATDYLGAHFVRYYRVSNSSWSESALAPDGTIYVSFDDQYLRAVDPNGSIRWVTSLGWLGGFTMTVGSDGLIYAASDDGYLYVLDPDGKEIARFKGYDGLSFPVITADNAMIVCDANNTVWAVGGVGCEGQAAVLHRPEDLNADWSVNFIDFAVMADGWLDCTDTSLDPLTEAPYCDNSGNEIFLKSDINRDQYVDSVDLAELVNRWLAQE
jgi:parallel beta-helix repeat protein